VVVDPEPEEDSTSLLELPGQPSPQPVPTTFGFDLIEATRANRRKKKALWPTSAETNVQLSLFD
jgi:hypothetical protein